MFSLEGKVAVITGAASGIGAETARRFTAAGATVVRADISDAAAAAAELGGRFVAVDVADDASVEALVAEVVRECGRIDVMVNNAGVLGPGKGILADSMDETRRVLEVNLIGVIHGTKHAARAMAAGSAIVNTASMAGVVGFPGISAYGASKWGVVGLTRHAAVELGPCGIRVNCVCPTGVDTPMTGDGHDHWAERSMKLAHQHTDRLASATDVAAAIHFLASDDAAMVNGHALWVDGGLGAGLSVDLVEAALGEPIRQGPAFIE